MLDEERQSGDPLATAAREVLGLLKVADLPLPVLARALVAKPSGPHHTCEPWVRRIVRQLGAITVGRAPPVTVVAAAGEAARIDAR